MKKCCKIKQTTVERRRREIELTDKFEIKIFILYLLKNIKEPLEFSTINDIVVQDGFVNYFDFAICFAELLESNQITELKGDKTLYVISAAGTEAVESVEDKIFVSVKEKALRSALRLLAFNRSGSRTRSRVEKAEKGYKLICSIEDSEKNLLHVEVFLTDANYAEKLRINYDERAEIIYKGVLSLLSGEVNFLFDE